MWLFAGILTLWRCLVGLVALRAAYVIVKSPCLDSDAAPGATAARADGSDETDASAGLLDEGQCRNERVGNLGLG